MATFKVISESSMVSDKHHAALHVYLNLMSEVRARLEVLKEYVVAHSGSEGMDRVVARESCFLQVRMLCETIALGCVAAHGDIKEIEGRRFQDSYEATKIINGLARLHPDFYPKPVERRGVGAPLEFVTSGFITAPELVALYGRCGGELHRGSMQAVKKKGQKSKAALSEFSVLREKFLRLLNNHYMPMIDNVWVVYCQMYDSDGKLSVGQMLNFNALATMATLKK